MAEDTWLASGVGYAAPPARCARAVHRKGTTGGFKKGSRFGKLSETVHRQRTKTVLVNILYPTVALNELVLTKEGRKRYHTPHRCHAELAEAPARSRVGRLHRLRVAASAQQDQSAPASTREARSAILS